MHTYETTLALFVYHSLLGDAILAPYSVTIDLKFGCSNHRHRGEKRVRAPPIGPSIIPPNFQWLVEPKKKQGATPWYATKMQCAKRPPTARPTFNCSFNRNRGRPRISHVPEMGLRVVHIWAFAAEQRFVPGATCPTGHWNKMQDQPRWGTRLRRPGRLLTEHATPQCKIWSARARSERYA